MTYKELAKQMADFYRSNPGSWTQGAAARDKDGHEVGFFRPEATQWCLVGLANRFCPGDNIQRLRLYEAVTGSELDQDKWNDAPGRTVEEVIEKLELVS